VIQAVFRVRDMRPAQQPQTRAGRVPSKRVEVPIEVGLIILAGLVRDPGAGQGLRVSEVEALEPVVQAVETRERLGCRAHQSLELGDQMLVAHAQLRTERIDQKLAVRARDRGHRLLHELEPGIVP